MATIAKISVDLVANSARFGRDLDKAQRKSRIFVARTLRGFKRLEDGLFKVSAATVALTVATTKTALSYDKALTKMVTQVGINRTQVNAWKGDFERIGAVAGKNLDELAEGMFFVTSAGLRGSTAIQTLEAAAKGAAIELGSVQTVADVSTSAMNAYGSANLSAAEATGILAGAVREGKASADEISQSIGSVLPVASGLGVQFHEVAAAMASMTRTGSNAAEASTQLNGILQKILKPSRQAKEILADYGLTMDDLRQSLKDKGLLATLEDLKSRLGSNQEAFTRIFDDARAVRGVFDLLGNNVNETRAIFQRLSQDGVGTLSKAFNEWEKSDSAVFQKSLAELSNKGTKLGALVLPKVANAMSRMVDTLKSATRWYKSLSVSQQDTVNKVGLFIVAAAPAIKALRFIATTAIFTGNAFKFVGFASIGALRKFITFLTATVLPATVSASTALVTALAGISLPVWAVIGVVAGAGAVFYTFRDEIAAALTPVGKFIKDAILTPIDKVLSTVAKTFAEFIAWLRDKVASAAELFGFDDLSNQLKQSSERMRAWSNSASDTIITDAVIDAGSAASGLASQAADKVGQIIDQASAKFDQLKSKASGLIGGIPGFGDLSGGATGNGPNAPLAPGQSADAASGAPGEGVSPEGTAEKQKGIWSDLTKHFSDQQALIQQSSANTWGGLLQQAAGSSKKLGKIYKALNLATAISNTAAAVTTALKSAPFPANLPAVAFAVAQGAVQVATIKGQFHDGIDNVPSTGTYLLEGGERVVDKRLNKDLSAYLARTSQDNRVSNSTFAPSINYTDNGSSGSNTGGREMLEEMISDLYNEYGQVSPFSRA
jgi:TP901 family phage tail tape measure protein